MAQYLSEREQVVEICKRMYNRGFISGMDGNVSIRMNQDRLMATPTAMNKGFITSEDIVEIDTRGNLIAGKRNPSSEIEMHLRVYQCRPDVNAVVHAHPPTATGFSVAGKPFSACVLPEMVLTIGWVPIVPYGTPGTHELPDAIEPYLEKHNALLLANHGALTVGADIIGAYDRMESLEHTAKIILVAHQLGRINLLSRKDVEKLMEMADPSTNPGCLEHGLCSLSEMAYPGDALQPAGEEPGEANDDLDAQDLEKLEDVISESIMSYVTGIQT